MMRFIVGTSYSNAFWVRPRQVIPIMSNQIIPHTLFFDHFQQLVFPKGENVGRRISFFLVETTRLHSGCVDEKRRERGGERRFRKGMNGDIAYHNDRRVGGSSTS